MDTPTQLTHCPPPQELLLMELNTIHNLTI